MRDTRNADTLGEVPLLLAIHGGLAATQRSQLRFDPLAGLPVLAIHADGSIELQITDIIALQAVDMIEDFGIGEVAVEGDIARNIVLNHPIDQLFAERSVIVEGHACGDAGLLLAEAAELQWVVLAGGTDVVGDQVIMGDQMTLFGMIPEPAGIFNQLAVVVDQCVIDRDDAVGGIACGRVVLQEREPALVEGGVIPVDLSNPAVQAGLVGGDGKLTIDATHSFAFSDEQAGQILREMPTLRLVGKQICVLGQEILYDRREFHNRWHRRSC